MRRFTAVWACLAWLIAGCPGEPATPDPPTEPSPEVEVARPAPRVALWVLCEGSQRVLENPERIADLLADARALGASDLFVQVYRGGRAWFDSTHADSGPWQRAVAEQKVDPLAQLVLAAHTEGLRVHAWVNVLSLAGNRDAPILRKLGKDAVHVDRRGRSILDFPDLELPYPDRATVRMGTPAVWLDPGAPGVSDHLVATVAELMQRYPELDGVHLDYIRYPDVLPFSPGSRFQVGVDFGYGASTRERFEAETGLRAPRAARGGDDDAWDHWRRDQVTQLVTRIREVVTAVRPDAELSAAVSAYPERAYLSLFQDWRHWVEEGLLDFAVPMLYSRDDHLFRQEARAYTGGIGGERIWIGLGSWLFASDPPRAAAQRASIEALGASLSLFSWDSIADSPALRAALAIQQTSTQPDSAATEAAEIVPGE
jgi:uncharacterized lipoprotein YddW (UPF0748 family)